MHAKPIMPSIDALNCFDTFLVAGRLAHRNVSVNLVADNILNVMDRHGIAEARTARTG